jgi:hypothetical protein
LSEQPTVNGSSRPKVVASILAVVATMTVLGIAIGYIWANSLGLLWSLFPTIGLVLLAAWITASPVAYLLQNWAATKPSDTRTRRCNKVSGFLTRHKRDFRYGGLVFFVLAVAAEVVWILQNVPRLF